MHAKIPHYCKDLQFVCIFWVKSKEFDHIFADMNLNKLIQDIKPHAIAIFAFFLVGYVYYVKTFNGYIHKEDDVTQGLLKGSEIKKYTDANGDFPGWTNSIFSGMPSTLIKGKPSGNVVKSYNYLTPFSSTAYPFQILFLSFIGFYMLMNAFKVKPLFGMMAALAYGFATYSISSVEAAHYTKVLAMALMPAILASLHWLFNGRYLLGGITLAFNMALQVYYFHYQITFYTIVCLLVMGIYYLVTMIKAGQIKQLSIAAVISILAVGAGVAANMTKIASTSKFADNTMRGGNDLVSSGTKSKTGTGASGLERDYAFAWSYSMGETFTLLIPGFYGGSSAEPVSESSKFFEATGGGDRAPLYFGDLTSTSGPVYIGAIIVFLFILGAVIVTESIKWPLLLLTLVSFILGWGKHFAVINDLLFDHLPYFNKFRTPMMAFCIAQVTMPLLGFLGLKKLYDTWQTEKAAKKSADANAVTVSAAETAKVWKKVLYTFYGVAGFCLLIAVMGSSIMELGGAGDEELKKQGYSNLIPVLKEDRASLLQKDALRSLAFISIAFGLLWAWYNKRIQKHIAMALIGLFAVVDLIGVDWRYLSWDDFTFEKGTVTDVEMDDVDKAILQDKQLHYRIIDYSGNDPFNSNTGAAFHKMVGGYDPAKLSRYQNVISKLIADTNQAQQEKALDMLNCKYIIYKQKDGPRGAFPRQTALGNAWFVGSLKSAANASEDMSMLRENNDLRAMASFVADFPANKGLSAQTFTKDSNARAELVSYHPDTMNYVVNNANDGYLVFSEMYYEDWKAELDGKPVTINKVDYTLRGMAVPAGSHKIKLYFDKGKVTTDNIEKYISIAILLGMLVLIGLWISSYFKKA